MAIIDWPNTDPFRPVLPYSFGVSTPKSMSRGYYTGEAQSVGHLSDRLVCSLTLPPCGPADAKLRSAFLFGALSNGDIFRFSPWGYRQPVGTIGGSPTASALAIAGARSLQITGALARPNLLTNSGFEIDTNSDGIADGWLDYSSGSVTGPEYGLPPGNSSPTAQRMFAGTLGPGLDDAVGVRKLALPAVVAGSVYSLSADWTASASTFGVELYVDWVNSSGGAITATRQSWPAPIGWTRLAINGMVAPAGAVTARIYAWIHQASSGTNLQAYVDNVQFEPGAVATAYAGLPTIIGGDVMAVGGNLLMAAYAGATLNDAGAGTIPLAMPLLSDVAATTDIAWNNPLGLWQIDSADGISLDFAAPVVQRGVTIPFRQRRA